MSIPMLTNFDKLNELRLHLGAVFDAYASELSTNDLQMLLGPAAGTVGPVSSALVVLADVLAEVECRLHANLSADVKGDDVYVVVPALSAHVSPWGDDAALRPVKILMGLVDGSGEALPGHADADRQTVLSDWLHRLQRLTRPT